MLKIFDKISDAALPCILPIEIICGDCCGDARLPIRTNLTSDGRCAVCFGRSFEIASRLCGALAQHLQNSRKEEEIWTEIITEKF